MREKATEEGTMAEHALRKLAAAAKAGAMKVEARRNGLLDGDGKGANGSINARKRLRARDDTFGDVLKALGDSDEAVELGLDDTTKTAKGGMDLGMPEGVIVNHDMAHWRRGKHRQGLNSYV